ncbi:competence/damage-inducible protein A [Nibribacter ruber]|uniref:CinA-like protein n=1 Tax=Nibribacter ruber TaxID=2698458 RepID=A0A6P1P3B0_9BACT|nr:competence/damage-inducible protein A [Nibribacter ruber]QHL88882.1 competence/damage-inducible protein A [Nibribacter ruber]
MKQEVSAEIITIGDELLYGQVVDTNSAWMGEELGKIGIKVKQITSISDSPDAIEEALDIAKTRAQVILMTGGLGPTKDDLTKHTLTKYFKTHLQLHQPSLDNVVAIFKKYNRPLTVTNQQQAYLPATCTPILNTLGTAPGMLFEENEHIIVSMPGVPFEMKGMMTNDILPYLQAHFQLPEINHKVIQTIGLGESFLADTISDWEDNLPTNLKLAYLPNLSGVRLRLTGVYNGIDDLEDQMMREVGKLSDLIPEYIFGYGEISLEETVGMLLNGRNYTISTAESCTGGLIGHKLTSVPGSSMYYKGGIIAYDNYVKINELGVEQDILDKYGAVSGEVVRQMAEGVRRKMGTDVGIATSGIAGPGGGTPDKPVGTIWIAYSDATQTIAKKLNYNKSRLLNIEYTALQALNLIRQSLPGPVEE